MPLPPLAKPKSLPVNLWRLCKGSFIFTFLSVLLLLCNIVQCLTSPLLLISRKLVRVMNRYIGGFWWGTCDLCAEYLWKINVKITGDPLPLRENVMVTVNHQDMADITTLFRLARRQKRIGDLKWFVKDMIKYVPGIGWGMIFLDCIFVKRNWKKDKERLNKQLSRFEIDQIPIWTLSFVEGTRLRPHKLEQSQVYAQQQGVEPHQHLLIPRTKGFCLTLGALRTHLDAVYDATIGYVDGVPTLWQWCRGDVSHVNVHVRRFAISEVPVLEEELSQWLKDRWYEKDQLLDGFYQTGQWPTLHDQPQSK